MVVLLLIELSPVRFLLYSAFVSPGIGAAGVAANAGVSAILTDGASSVDTGSVKLTGNGEDTSRKCQQNGRCYR
jgi:hypothetical protein